ncbi:MAG: hypothetical protein JW862_05755 [Anaerolineales bacterium]|nr:hypothetical protein [Anaerolineales bacterium]
MNSWYFRDYALQLTRRWYVLLGAFLLGTLLGWITSLIWPASYRATEELYVGLNAYRVSRDRYIAQAAEEQFTNLDDYKHWQMSQIESIALSEGLLQEALLEMGLTEPSWELVTVADFRMMIDLIWRDAGVWRFSVTHADRDLARQAAQTWSALVLQEIQQAVEHAQQVQFLDAQYLVVAREATTMTLRQVALIQIQAELQAALQELVERPGEASLSQQHQRLLALMATAADWDAAWQALLQEAPAATATAGELSGWIQSGLALIRVELETLPAQIAMLDQQADKIQQAYAEQGALSRSVAANVSIEAYGDQDVQLETLRPKANNMVIGGLLGLFAWLGAEMIVFSRGKPDAE